MSVQTKKIVCLANSYKISGRCIAGMELLENGTLGNWIRPVSARPSHEISENERRYENGTTAQVFDIVEFAYKRSEPEGFQQENILIDDRYHWVKHGEFSTEQLLPNVQSPAMLWTGHGNTIAGINDKIPEHQISGFSNSLYLITPDKLSITVHNEGLAKYDNVKRKVRSCSEYGGMTYSLRVTDPDTCRIFFARMTEHTKLPIPKDAY